jgi:predicted nucleic acid-binding protein
MLQTNDNYFIDSNICYLISESVYKKEIAKNLLLPNTSFISTQVLSENINVLFKKFKQLSIDDISKHIDLLVKYNSVVTI